MKKLTLAAFLSWMLFGSGVANATFVSKIIDPVYPEALTQMKAADFIKLTLKDFTKLSQKKLTLKEKIAFSVLKKNLKRELKKNPNLIVSDYLASTSNQKISGWAWVAMVLGVLLIIFLIGVVAYNN